MYDCFITSDMSRPYLFALTYHALVRNGMRPKLVRKPLLERYYECEDRARTPIYLVCDDDCVPADDTTIRKLVDTMKSYGELSQLGLGWKADMGSERDSPWKLSEMGDDVWEFDHCGGIVAVRKGSIKNLGYKAEYPNGYGDDRVMGKTARELGYKVGVTPKLYFHHLGANQSTFVP